MPKTAAIGSTLPKKWCNFLVQKNGAILNGHCSQTHKRFKGDHQQGAAVCIVSCALANLKKVDSWTRETLDNVLHVGTNLHLKTLQMLQSRCTGILEPHQVYKYFFLDNVKVTMNVGVNSTHEKLNKDKKPRETLLDLLKKFLMVNEYGVLTIQKKFFAIWRGDKAFFLFDPSEYEPDGTKWQGLPTTGYCYVLRATNLASIADQILSTITLKQITKLHIHPCIVEKTVKVNTVPPENLYDLLPVPKVSSLEKLKKNLFAKIIKKPSKANLEAPKLTKEELEEKAKTPPEKPKIQSVTNFNTIGDGNSQFGILRASTHQNDPKFTRYAGAQGLANAIAVLTMRRVHPSKRWVKKLLDDVLKLGEVIHHESKKLPKDKIPERVTLYERDYSPKFTKYGTIGQLQSEQEGVLDLLPALTNFFADHDCCVIVGPYVAAAWLEENIYYLFDPNERNSLGRRILQGETGVACITWHNNLKNLVATYLSNVPVTLQQSKFFLSKVSIRDFVEKPEDWYNFNALTEKRWILRGTCSQFNSRVISSSKGVQCTANATVALTQSYLLAMEDWDVDLMDKILSDGNDLYIASVQVLKEKGKFLAPLLMVDEIKRHFILDGKQIDYEIADCIVNGIVNAKKDSGLLGLKEGFEEFFTHSMSGVITCNSLSMSFWKKDDVFYYYDSHTRNEKGLSASYGSACILRLLSLADLALYISTNVSSTRDNFYNLSRVIPKIIETTDEGIVIPPLNNYQPISEFVAILRSTLSTISDVWDLSTGGQTVPMCLAALALNQLSESDKWGQVELDQIMTMGDKLYVDTLSEKEALPIPEDVEIPNPEEPAEPVEDPGVTLDDVKKSIKIGTNRLEFEVQDHASGNLEGLKEALEGLFGDEATPVGAFQSVLTSEFLTGSMWRDDHLIYFFDPRPRDARGGVFGKDDWSVLEIPVEEPPEEEEEEKPDEQEGEGEDLEDQDERGGAGDADAAPTVEEDEEKVVKNEDYEDEQEGEGEEEPDEQEGEDELEPEPFVPVVEKKGSEFWRTKEEDEGKACVLRFVRVEDLANHILENAPPKRLAEIEFQIKNIKIKNVPVVHKIFDPELEVKVDELMGDWFVFKEIDYGRWILRGSKNLDDETFLKINRGKQVIGSCLTALAFVRFYHLSKFKKDTVNSIICYGDRLLSATRRKRFRDLKDNKDLGLTEEELEQIIAATEFASLDDYPQKFCISEKLAVTTIEYEVVRGDSTSKSPNDVPDLTKGIQDFYNSGKIMGIIECNGYMTAIWTEANFYYMFDSLQRGPNGVKSPTGVPCITRFIDLKDLIDIFKKNIPEFGSHIFTIHAINIDEDVCHRERQPVVKPIKPLKLGGFTVVVPGKDILRGDLKLDFSRYDHGVHIHSPAIAMVTLAMSLIQKPETWTKVIINEILDVGEELYDDSVAKLGPRYDPWSDKLDLYRVNSDFKVGTLKVNTAMRYMDQRGIVDAKNSKIPNLRQGVERFFEENTHGVLFVDKFILPLWEEEREDETTIYLLDPNSRGATGLPTPGGVACAMRFCNAVMATDHVIACLMGVDKDRLEFAIVPVEVVVGSSRSRRKVKVHDVTVKKLEMPKPPKKSCIPVTCPSKAQELEVKRTLRNIAEEERREKQAKLKAQLGRKEFYKINDNESVLRGCRSMSCDRDITTNITAFVLMKVIPIDKWTCREIETVIETGNQLYVDSYVAYKPDNAQLNLDQILRRFYFNNYQVQIQIFKPYTCAEFVPGMLSSYMTKLFERYNFLMINYEDKWVSAWLKGGFYYYFDGYGVNLRGERDETCGSAVMMKFTDIGVLTERIIANVRGDIDEAEAGEFRVVLVNLQSANPLERKEV